MKRVIALAACAFVMAGCQWVKPSDEGRHVSLVKMAHVVNCEKIGATSVAVKSKVGIVERKNDKVTDELVTLAKNEAAKVNGDTIVAKASDTKGEQSFDIYRCY